MRKAIILQEDKVQGISLDNVINNFIEDNSYSLVTASMIPDSEGLMALVIYSDHPDYIPPIKRKSFNG